MNSTRKISEIFPSDAGNLLRMPQNGTCVFTRIWSKNQNLLDIAGGVTNQIVVSSDYQSI